MRAIVYPHKVRAAQEGKPAPRPSPAYRGRGARPSAERQPVESADADDYLARLAKHVPAEALAVLLLLAGQLGSDSLGWRLAAVAFPCLMAVVLDRERRSRLGPELQPTGVVYDLFVIVAFAAWALGTTDLARDLIGIDQSEASFVVLAVAFGLGYFDDGIGERFENG
jgi:hypothetical protein